MRDEEGARRLIKLSRALVLFLVVSVVVSATFVVWNVVNWFISPIGGVDVALSIVSGVRSERPLVFAGGILLLLFVIAYGFFSIGGFLLMMREAFDKQVHISVTDSGVSVHRDGSRSWQSSGVEIPLDAITSVEYLDPEESSIRVELGDWRSKQFFAGRSRSWIRIERTDGATVYVGSDRPFELAETIARMAPDVETTYPF